MNLRGSSLFYYAWIRTWATRNVAEYRARVWDRLAFATRYGHQPLSELLGLDLADLFDYCDALTEIVKGEARGARSG